jgi:hypothetical protein
MNILLWNSLFFFSTGQFADAAVHLQGFGFCDVNISRIFRMVLNLRRVYFACTQVDDSISPRAFILERIGQISIISVYYG